MTDPETDAALEHAPNSFDAALFNRAAGLPDDTVLEPSDRELLESIGDWLPGLKDALATTIPEQTSHEPVRHDDPVAQMLGLVPDKAIILDGRSLANAREAAGLSLDQLVELLQQRGWHVTTTSASSWEHDHATPPPAIVDAIATELGVDANQLLAPPPLDNDLNNPLNVDRNDHASDLIVGETQTSASRPPDDPSPAWETEIDRFKQELEVRLPDVQCHRVWMLRSDVNPPAELVAALKVSCLDTSILVTVVDGTTELPSLQNVIGPLELLLGTQPDADAAVVCLPYGDWPAALITTQHLRSAWQLPDGIRVGPRITLQGLGLVDILAKYLDSAMTAWEVTEQSARSLGSVDLREMAGKHANASIESVIKSARRSGPRALDIES
jgi:transcriptional regulator with XRE-family HTH domain